MMEFEKVLPQTYLLRTPHSTIWSGVYLLTGDPCIMIDTGESDAVVDDCIVPALRSLSLTPKDIDFIINTHSHGDHAGGNRRLRELSNHAKIVAFEKAVDKIENPLPYSIKIRTRFPKFSPAPPKEAKGCPVDVIVKNGDIVGNRLKVISSPGHDSECISLLDIATGALFTGDSLMGFGETEAGGTGLAFYQDLPRYKDSIAVLRSEKPEHIFASHNFAPYGYCAHGEKEVERYFDASRITADIYDVLINRQIESGVTDIAEIAKKLILQVGSEPPTRLFMAMYTVSEHIKDITGQDSL